VNRRTFITAAVPTVLGAGATRIELETRDDHGKSTAARSEPNGTQRILWSGGEDDGVALTFDDGPDDELTPQVLDVLAARDLRATFLLIGERAQARPDLVRRIVEEGHVIGNHSWSHPSMARCSRDEVRDELRRTHDLLSTFAEVTWFRPPRGILTGVAAQIAGQLGCGVLLWSATFRGLHLDPGTIVCLHDGIGRTEGLRGRRRREIAALPAILDDAIAGGVRFVPVASLVR
jgi:peptidoglycan/xylan/chitin deacetylase (PgdA/CDA1 family)